MRTHLALLSSLAVLAACGKGQTSEAGSINLQLRSELQQDDGGTQELCAQYAVQPHSVGADGQPTSAGQPTSINAGSPALADSTILGCVAGPTDSAGYNWALSVTATGFADCTSGEALSDLSPVSQSQQILVDCIAGQDVPASGVFKLGAPLANNGGYVDLSGSAQIQLADGGTQPACAQVTLTPQAIGADGGRVDEGAPVIFDLGPATAGETVSILGCVDATDAGNDWGYAVSATRFTACDADGGQGAAITGLAMDPVTFNLAMNCVAGQDVALEVPVIAVQAP